MQAANYLSSLPEKLFPHKPSPTTETKYHPTETCRALEFHGTKDVRVVHRPKPVVTKPKDAIVKITTTTVCGSDLHLYHREIPELEKGDVLGHEAVGIVESVGEGVTSIKPGQRVVVSAILACGECWHCQHQMFSNCETTNNSATMETLYGHTTAGILGYSHLLGGYDGAQAEYIRIPYADLNLLPVPAHLSDEQVICLSDIACTGWHGVDLGEVSGEETRKRVAIWGLGPVGLMAVRWALYRGAEKVVAIDCVEERLALAQKIGAVPLNYKEVDVYEALKKEFPRGPDVAIDCVGFRYTKSWLHAIQKTIGIETDSADVINEVVKCVRTGGVVVLIGDYVGVANTFPIGPLMEKGLTERGGQVHVQKYWKKLLSIIEKGEMDPTFVNTHTFTFDQMSEVYKIFDEKKCIKAIVKVA